MGTLISVNFRSDTLFAVEQDDGVFVAIKPICDNLGLNWRKQRERIQEDQILSEGCTISVTPTPGGPQEMLCLRLDLVNGWMLSVQDRGIPDPAVREKVLVYKRECYRVLYEHFTGKSVLVHEVPNPDLTLPTGERRKLVTEARQTFGTAAARALWAKLDLAWVAEMERPDDQPDIPGLVYRAVPEEAISA